MNPNDYAILIGIDSYPELGEGNSPVDLRGPRNDVDAMKKWLLDPNGGGLPGVQNIFEPLAVPHVPGAAVPTAGQLDQLMSNIDGVAQANKKARKGMQVGRRLYIYMSGHGFSPGRQRACLFTADAKERLGLNIHATGWLNWLQDAGYFREFVLWVDACMNRASFLQPHDPPLPLAAASNPPLANFVAFAAQRPLKAVEVPIAEDEDRTHGVFTWTLLEGLRGAAADVNGRVTGRSLADWVRNAQSARFVQRDRDDRDVAQEPEVVQEDSGLIFARGVTPPAYEVTLTFKAPATGANAHLWSGSPPVVSRTFTVDDGPKVLALKPGLYLMEVPDAGLRHGFEVVRPTKVAIVDAGVPVMQFDGSEVYRLDVDPGDPTAEIFVVDNRFSLVDYGPAHLSTPLPPGLFKVKIRIGNAITQRVVMLDRDHPLTDLGQAQLLATVVPLPDTAASHEYHQAGRRRAVDAANALVALPGQAVIMVMVRTYSSKIDTVPGTTPPWHGVSIVDANGEAVIDMEQVRERHEGGDAYAFSVAAVHPGSYFLRQDIEEGHAIEQSLIVCAGWRTEVFVLRRVVPGATKVDPRPRAAVMMRRLGEEHDAETDAEDRMAETAKQAMANERRILSARLEEMLMLKSRNPVAGIIGGHLLLIERERDSGRDISMLDTVVANLRGLLGEGHPDVEALALQCADPKLRRVNALRGPPMFQRSWALLAQAARKRVDLVPADMWARIQALAALPPFLVWNTDEEVKSSARKELARAVLRPQVSTPPSPPSQALQPGMLPKVAKRAPRSVPRSPEALARLPRATRARAASLNLPPCALEALKAGME
ncbi:hypothetical protein SAMN05444679_110175 [Variovorax sp. CF079]|uniref:caspase family protein n=1 Tax=Variovorax sp. CF079 TaxID=1882774 RepID=UPI00088B3473|nr:caspase family protein [Variovorax sp. CF079]SDD44523.1 hypothetical protein SAMN05444679_110175 [Variovorax sp. CF079]